jgi:hypothetical protein
MALPDRIVPPSSGWRSHSSILWFRLSKQPGDPEGIMGGFNMGRGLIMLERIDHWQLGYVLPKGTYQYQWPESISSTKRRTMRLLSSANMAWSPGADATSGGSPYAQIVPTVSFESYRVNRMVWCVRA